MRKWIMPLLFTVAGISSAYALKRRSPRQYLQERIHKLLLPLLFGIALLMSIITYFADRSVLCIWIIIAAYYVFKLVDQPALQMELILLVSIPLTFATDYLCRQIAIVRWMLGLKKFSGRIGGNQDEHPAVQIVYR